MTEAADLRGINLIFWFITKLTILNRYVYVRTLLELFSHSTVWFLPAIKPARLKLTSIDGTVIINVLSPNQTKAINVFCVIMCCHIAVRILILWLSFSTWKYWLIFLLLQKAFRIMFHYNSALLFITMRLIYNTILHCNVCSRFCTTFLRFMFNGTWIV